jgi:UDP-N-acetylmuramoyl-tripeptide--D-alanyl-D-alanine ligase
MKLPLSRVAEFTHATGEFDHKAVATGYSIDTRTLQHGDLFFAVKGERLDGHDYVDAALAAGAVAAVVSKEQYPRFTVKSRLLVVKDTLAALQSLSSAVRRIWGKPVVGVTGSMGKTTTKECIAHVLSSRFRVLKSVGNLNNHFGMPLQLLRLEPEHQVAVIEIGMSHAGEITSLSALAQPDIGVVTNVAPVHLEFFDSIADIARAKYELIASLPSGGTAILNSDDEYVSQFGRDFRGKVVMFGIHKPADICAQNVVTRGQQGSEFDLSIGGLHEHATLPLVGEHNILNALAAVAVAVELGIQPSTAVASLATISPADKRGEVEQFNGATIVNDCYNSNPKALRAMVDALVSLPAKRRIVVAGEMLELGPSGGALHRECGEYIASRNIDMLLGVRGLASSMVEAARAKGMKASFVTTPEDAGAWLAGEIREGDAVLFKASRGVRLEKALETLRNRAAATK